MYRLQLRRVFLLAFFCMTIAGGVSLANAKGAFDGVGTQRVKGRTIAYSKDWHQELNDLERLLGRFGCLLSPAGKAKGGSEDRGGRLADRRVGAQ